MYCQVQVGVILHSNHLPPHLCLSCSFFHFCNSFFRFLSNCQLANNFYPNHHPFLYRFNHVFLYYTLYFPLPFVRNIYIDCLSDFLSVSNSNFNFNNRSKVSISMLDLAYCVFTFIRNQYSISQILPVILLICLLLRLI